MPHAIFFSGGFAIHGTSELSRLGGPASHDSVRLHPSHAAALFSLVARRGPRHTRIDISNQADAAAAFNGSITLSIIDEISCGRARIRAFAAQSPRDSELLHKEAGFCANRRQRFRWYRGEVLVNHPAAGGVRPLNRHADLKR
jgi:hypothetical protein